jgi:hypothetical protein
MNGDEDQPIQGLSNLETPVSAGFLQLFRRRIYRRTTTAQLAHFSFSLPIAIFMELVSIIVHLLAVVGGKKGKSR